MAIVTSIARDLIWLLGLMVGIALIGADFDYPAWVETLLAVAGFWLIVNCSIRIFPRGMWPFHTTTKDTPQ